MQLDLPFGHAVLGHLGLRRQPGDRVGPAVGDRRLLEVSRVLLRAVGVLLEEHRLEQVHQGDVEDVDPVAVVRLGGCRVLVPRPARGEQHVTGPHLDPVALDDGVGPVALEDDPQGGGGVVVRERGLSRLDQLVRRHHGPDRRVDVALGRVGERDVAAVRLGVVDEPAGDVEDVLHLRVVPHVRQQRLPRLGPQRGAGGTVPAALDAELREDLVEPVEARDGLQR